ncbi:hypothetical protein [Rathayibacter soli]|uniref:hypothetical protein n=1 Tax=Rathayibacter soli TaxID=3144168 RepID=UPI0027E45860|nr:hypothetical protein [Glaciibacter superstes]
MTVFVTMLLLVTVAASLGETYAFVTYRGLVRGSHPRYVWRTAYLLLAWSVIVLCVGLAFLDVVEGDTLFAALWLAVAGIRAYQLYLNRKSDDDDWFKGRGHKIWAGIKRRVTSLAPTGAPVPQPVRA